MRSLNFINIYFICNWYLTYYKEWNRYLESSTKTITKACSARGYRKCSSPSNTYRQPEKNMILATKYPGRLAKLASLLTKTLGSRNSFKQIKLRFYITWSPFRPNTTNLDFLGSLNESCPQCFGRNLKQRWLQWFLLIGWKENSKANWWEEKEKCKKWVGIWWEWLRKCYEITIRSFCKSSSLTT